MRRPCTKKDAPAEQHGIWRKMSFTSRMREKVRFILPLKPGQCQHPLRKDERSENSVDSGASMHMLSKKNSSDELDTLRKSRNPTVVLTANAEVPINEEAQCNYLKQRLLLYRLENSAKNTVILVSGPLVKNHSATQRIHSYPCKTKTSQETEKSLLKFLEPSHKPKVICTDNSLEFGKSGEDLTCTHRTSTPDRSETSGIAERAVRRVKEGTSAVLPQSGLDEKWWADSVVCCCYLRNIHDLLGDGKTPCARPFGEPVKEPVILFEAMVAYHPISVRDQSRLHHFGKKVLLGIFFGYELVVVRIWKGETLIGDLKDLEEFDIGFGKVARIMNLSSKNRSEGSINIFLKVGEFFFPEADGTAK